VALFFLAPLPSPTRKQRTLKAADQASSDKAGKAADEEDGSDAPGEEEEASEEDFEDAGEEAMSEGEEEEEEDKDDPARAQAQALAARRRGEQPKRKLGPVAAASAKRTEGPLRMYVCMRVCVEAQRRPPTL